MYGDHGATADVSVIFERQFSPKTKQNKRDSIATV